MKHLDEKKQHIIYTGLKALCLKGYNATGVKEITDAAGIPKGSFYNYFSSKEKFAIEAMEFFTDKELALMQKSLEHDSLPPLKRIEHLYKIKVDHFIEKASFSLGCFLCNMTLEMADVSEPIAKAATQLFKKEDELIINCLKEAQKCGDLGKDVDVEELTGLIRDSWLGALIIMKANKSPVPLHNFLNNLEKFILR